MQHFIDVLQSEAFLWLTARGPAIIGIIIGTYILHRVLHPLVDRAIRRTVKPERGAPPEAEKKREDTLIRIFHNTLLVVLWTAAAMMILSEAGVNIGPLLAAAGIVGVAFGFGGQYLIRDVISGFFIIMENQYRIGDVACVDATCGLVEDITMRITTLRDLDGTVHHVPNGSITKTSNLSKLYARVNLNVGISYAADLEKVIKVVNETGRELASDPAWKDQIITPPAFLRVDDFADSSVTIKILGDTKPLKQWDVTGELRKRLKIAFDHHHIEIPFPQRVVHTAPPAVK
jgi:small conductance mechanosensitive channel